jgi:sulfoxide reductase heme-binding subunit YedZ
MRRAIYIAGMLPATWTFYLGVTDQLGADPQNTLLRTLGLWALRFLIIGLAISPLRLLGGPNLIRYRRTIGLLAFYYATLHLTVYLVLDQGLDLAAIWADIVKRPYITVGMLAFALLVPLAATSNNAMIRRLRGGAWQRLHRLVYVAAAAAAIHFIMLVKAWPPEPLIYAGLVVLLLGFRAITALQRQQARAASPARTTRR